jgi:hypothetical protein
MKYFRFFLFSLFKFNIGLISMSIFISLTPSLQADTISNWYSNPANGHEYALWGFGNWIDAYNATPTGAHLVTFSDVAEEHWVWETFGSIVEKSSSAPSYDWYRVWIGFTDSENYGASEGNWRWITGEAVTYTNWGQGEPNNMYSGEDFAESHWPTYYWNDLGQSTFFYTNQAIFENDQPSNIPEASTITLLGIGIAGFITLKLRRQL